MSIRRHIASLAGAMGIGLAATSVTPLHAQSKSGDLTADSRFIREAASDNLLEIRLGQMAEKQGANAEVKQFGQRMITDHTTMQNQWVSLASKGGLTLKPALGPRHEQKVERLEKLSGKKFDQAYITSTVQNHRDDVDYFENESKSAHSAQVRDLAANDLRTLQQDLTLAKEIGSKVGADTTATRSRHVTASKTK